MPFLAANKTMVDANWNGRTNQVPHLTPAQRKNWVASNRLKRHGAMMGLGANSSPYVGYPTAQSGPYRYGTKNWWVWYATTYLPQYYSQQEAYQMLLRSPYYTQYGLPSQYQQYYPPYNTYQQPYQYPPNYGYQQSYNPYGYMQYPQQYIPYGGTDYGAIQCNQYGGIYNAFTQSCSSGAQNYSTSSYGTGAPPNVIGQSMNAGVQALNYAGYAVWLLNQDGISAGAPVDYQPGRVQIAVANGLITQQSVG